MEAIVSNLIATASKKKGFTAPDGSFYEWTKSTPPTQADVDAIVAFHENKVGLKSEFQNFKQRKGSQEEGLRKMQAIPKSKAYLENKKRFQSEQRAARIDQQEYDPVQGPPKAFTVEQARARSLELDPRPEGVKAAEWSGQIAEQLGKMISPVTDPLGEALAHTAPWYSMLRGTGTIKQGTGGKVFTNVLANVVNTPMDIAMDAGVIASGRATIPEIGGALANTALNVGILDPIDVGKAVVKGVKGVKNAGKVGGDLFEQALKSAEGGGAPKRTLTHVKQAKPKAEAPTKPGRVMYREASPSELMQEDFRRPGKHFSDNPDLAIGQGENKGIIYEVRFDDKANLRENPKPGTQVEGVGKEYVVGDIQNTSSGKAHGELVSITVKKGTKLSEEVKYHLDLQTKGKNGIYEKEVLPNGDVKYTVKEAPKSPKAEPSSARPPVSKTTGLANQQLDREAVEGIINEVEKTKGKGAEHWQKVGKEAVDKGADPINLSRRIANAGEELTGEKVGILLEGKRQLQARLNNAAPGEEYQKALSDMTEYLDNVQQGKGRWSDVGRALQAGTELDTGDFAQVLERVHKMDGTINKKTEAQLRDLTEQVKTAQTKVSELEKTLAEEQAKRTTARQAKQSPRFSREELDQELESLLKEFSQSTAKLSSGIDPNILPIVGKIAINYMKRGVNTLDDVVKAVKAHFPDATYDDVVQGIDSATKGTKRTQSDIQKEISRLKREAKSNVKAKGQIADLQKQLESGDYEIPTKQERVISKRLEDLRAERDLLSNEVKGRIGNRVPQSGWEVATNILNKPKSLKSSIDISAPGRQGWLLGAANPDKIPTAFWDQLKALASPKLATKAQNRILARANAAKYKRMGLYLSPLEGGSEEAFKGGFIDAWKKFNPFKASERAYTAYLNRMRADVADRLIKWAGPNATDDDLKVIGNYINVASGRGGKSIHLEGKAAEALNNVFFSPRFVASRFEYLLGQPLLTGQGKLGKSLKGRALVAQQYASTIGTIGTIIAFAKHMNPKVNTDDPTKSDFLTPKIGDTKLDVLGGLRQTINLGARLLDRDPKKTEYDKQSDFGRFTRSKGSPTAGAAYSLYTGKDFVGEDYGIKDALLDLISPLSLQELVEGARKDGWNDDDFLGLLNFLGINTQTYSDEKKKKERPN